MSYNLDWFHYYSLWEGLTPAERRVADLVGVSEAFIARAIRGRIPEKTEKQRKGLAIHRRFYTALTLNALVINLFTDFVWLVIAGIEKIYK